MASKEDDNKLECNSNVNKEQERNLVNVYKKYDVILNNKTESFEKKIQSIIDVWQSIAAKNLSESDIRYVTQIMDWAKLHALNIVLTAEWKDYKAKYEESLLKEIEKVQVELLKISTAFSSRFQKLADVVRNPWEGPILVKLLSQKDAEIGPDEIEFFCVETAYLVSYRLKKLCESQCEDLALNLVTAFMKCRELSKTQNFNLNANETQIWFIFDIYVALLYKFQQNSKIVSLLKELTLEEGLQLIKRFAKKQVKISKIWKHCQKIAVLACQVFVSTAAVKFSEEHRSILENLVECFISICNTEALLQNLTTSLKRISQLADAAGLYVFCDVVHRKAGIKLKPFTIEMYIRALTADMNNLERQKNDNESEKVAGTTKRLASAFCKLADLLNDHVKVTRECVLTAFSLEPTEERLKKIIELAKRSGFQVLDTGQEWKCKLHPPIVNKDEVAWICTSCGDWTCKPQLNIPLNTNIALNEALQADDLGISAQLRDDLAVCLSNPRYQVLSWLLPWEDLHRICVMYTHDPERTKNVVTELKFVDIDYSLFKHIKREPLDELAGIERGYEQYLDHDFNSDDQMSTISEDSASQDSRPYSLGSDGAGDTPYLQQTKSDPNTLKSLRMFRPNLKRSRPSEPGQSVPEKLYKMGVTDVPPTPSTSKANVSYANGIPNNIQYHAPQPSHTNVTPPKNGLVATLPPHGGQVATNQINQATLYIPLALPTTTTTSPCNLQAPPPISPLTKELIKIQLQRNFSCSGMPASSSNNNNGSCYNNGSSNNSKSPTTVSHPPVSLPMVNSSSNCSQSIITTKPISSSSSNNRGSSSSSSTITVPNPQPTSTISSSSSTTTTTTVKPLTVPHPPAQTTTLDLNKFSYTQCNNNGISVQSASQDAVKKCPPGVPDVPASKKSRKCKFAKSTRKQFPEIIVNKNLTENIRTYGKEISGEKKDCVKTPKDGVCKNVNNVVDKHPSVVQSRPFELKQLKVVLQRLPEEGTSAKPICIVKNNNRSKNGRRRKSNDKSENKVCEKAPKRVQIYKLSPLQDINPRVPSVECLKGDDFDPKNPRVMLERLPDSDLKGFKNYGKKSSSLLNSVPGMDNYEHIRPANVNHIVNVVQISGGRPASNVSAQNTQTSTQVTPHIQRIGQPRTEKPEQTDSETPEIPTSTHASATVTSGKPTTSQPSTLINILSQQIIRPGQSNCVRTRPSPLINILSQQIIRPNPPVVQKVVVSNANVSPDSQINNVAKVTTTTAETVTVNTVKNVATVKNVVTTQASGTGGTILQFICKSSTLPKFQQAFGKSVYTNATETSEAAAATVAESTSVDANKKPTVAKNIPVNVQPIQGSVIYTRQMPVGQTINLIPPGRGQVFRIATSNSDQISLVKDTVIHSKMSALLAAALQGKKSTDNQADGEVALDDGSRVTVARPTLVQNARIVKPVLQIPSNVIRTSPQSQSSSLSSTTLEQLREFDMVYKQIKERSSTGSTPAEVNATTVESNDATPQRISVTYVNQGQKYTQLSPVVVVSSAYCNLQPAASPALSVTSQGSSSPCVTPAPTPTLPKVASKSSKGKTLKNSTTTHASKSSPIPKPPQKPQEDEHTTQRIFDILAEYAEQLRNSPDLNNKPAPRRRSNPPTNPSQNSKRKKSSGSKSKSGQSSTIVSEADTDDQRTMESEDSSCGVLQLSVSEEEPQVQAVTTSEPNENPATNSRQLILTSQDSAGNTQTRNLIIADSSVGEALKMPNTAVLVPGNYIMPVSMVKGGQQIAVMSGGSKILATVPARSGPANMLLFQSFLNQNRKGGVSTVKYSTIQPLTGISSQSLAGVSAQPPVILPPNSHAVALGQPLTLKKVDDPDRPGTELLLTISQHRDSVKAEVPQPDSSTNVLTDEIKEEDSVEEKVYTFQKSIITTPIATPVIAQAIKEEVVDECQQNMISLDIHPNDVKDEIKVERVQSVLVTACTSNGPMLSHTPPRYRKPSETITSTNEVSNKQYLNNGDKQNSNADQKHFATTTVYYQNKNKKSNPQRLDRELSIQRKQAALERELRLQKSLSEECEDLGVDEPSTSDLFPEAELLFDSNHSPSFDQDLMKRPHLIEVKEEGKSAITLFSDDDNSSSMRTNLFEYVDEYPTADNELVFDSNRQLTNGQSSTSNESASSCCEDSTLLQNCASMSDVTLNSPLSPPDLYADANPPSNKYKFKYSNRKKGGRSKPCSESWSSEDTEDAEPTCNKHACDEEFKMVRVKADFLRDDESCEEDLDSASGRGARRSVKKTCSCCNGSQDGVSRKRPHTPQKKPPFLNKKR
ncbi:unnamed protein product [Brassicogethes aeneus]|uniref:Uncharacterized protein n=1 Tax=Brassicogethes aeneus TaxID=1431903 RepID=A0A9P0BG80_BRAAE|nr:unnamed protein product [Brassicogethes aeneus]